MSAHVDVLAVLDEAQALVYEPGKRGEEWALLIAEARAAVAELIAAVADNDSDCPCSGCERIRAALARCSGGAA